MTTEATEEKPDVLDELEQFVPTLKVQDCHRCGQLMVAERHIGAWMEDERVRNRCRHYALTSRNGRPVCNECVQPFEKHETQVVELTGRVA